jgi:hypothetical protein
MGEVVLGIQRSQKTPHPQAQKFEDVERLILDSKERNQLNFLRPSAPVDGSTYKLRAYKS